jgi:hyperosmotically inducible protein
MKNNHGKRLPFLSATFILILCTALNTGIGAAQEPGSLQDQIRRSLIMLPYYSVFDYLAFELNGNNVILKGQVDRASLKSDAEYAVKKIRGIETVQNEIEILPVSPTDSRIRLDTYRAIYYHPNFIYYAIQAVPPIHIVVKNGDVTLLGSVAREGDRIQAELLAKGVPGVFTVTNRLEVNP